MMERRDAAGALLALLLIAGCRLPPQEIITTWPEGLLPGYQELNCEWYDPDSTAIRYSYMLPTVDGSEIERLRWQIHRSGWKAGSPRESCFAVLEQTSNHLVMKCTNPGNLTTEVWVVRINSNVATVTAGPARAVLEYDGGA